MSRPFTSNGDVSFLIPFPIFFHEYHYPCPAFKRRSADAGTLFVPDSQGQMPCDVGIVFTVHIGGDLRKYCEGQHSLSLEGTTVADVLRALTSRYSDLMNRLFQGGKRNRFISVFVNDEDIRCLQDVETPLKDGDEITIFPPVGGGTENIEKLAELLGAKVVGDVPEVEPGVFGCAKLAEILAERLEPSQGKRPGRPTNLSWVRRPKVPMSVDTVRKLIEISNQVSTDTRRVSPMQVAAHLLEEAVSRYCQTSVRSDGKQDEPEVRYDDRP